MFDFVRSDYKGESTAKNLIYYLGKNIRMVGDFVTAKYVPIAKGTMAFGSFIDIDGNTVGNNCATQCHASDYS